MKTSCIILALSIGLSEFDTASHMNAIMLVHKIDDKRDLRDVKQSSWGKITTKYVRLSTTRSKARNGETIRYFCPPTISSP